MRDPMALLRQCGIKPTPQRIAVVENVLKSKSHPSADDVLDRARRSCPTISRATVYNTLNLLVEKGLLCTQILKEGTVVFDPMTERHHHFIDDETGDIYDIPWDTLAVTGKEKLKDFVVREYQVIIRGRRKSTK
jgi:Fe2+ or Zn2+ uptake regulation protein